MSIQKPQNPVVCLAYANERTPHGFLRQLTVELKDIMNALEGSVRQERLHLKVIPAVTQEEIANVFQDEWYEGRVQIFHYGGHADEDELWLETEDGGNQSFFSLGLARFLGVQEGLKLVFLNGCATREHADLLLKANIPAVIATSRKINDKQARQFAETFYKGLASGASIEEAFGEAEGMMLGQYGPKGHAGDISRSIFWEDLTEEKPGFPWRLFLREENSWIAARWRLFYKKQKAEKRKLEAKAFINETIGNYKILEILGTGSTGVVYKAIHISLSTEVALKLTHRALTGYDQLKQIIFSGNKGLSTIDHPNVVKFMDVGEVELFGQKRLYIVMELIKGQSLDKLNFGISVLRRGEIERLAYFGLQLCDAVKVVHETQYVDEVGVTREGFVHGGIKPRKILLTEDGTPKLTDFMFTDLRQNRNIKLETPENVKARDQEERLEDYYPPEVLSGRIQVNKQTDIYAIGAVFLEIFVGKRMGDVRFSNIDELHDLIREKNRHFSKKFTRVIYKAVHPNPRERYQKMGDMSNDLWKDRGFLGKIFYRFKRK